MKTCARCGRENHEESAFCAYCGGSFTSESEALESGPSSAPPGPGSPQEGAYTPEPPPFERASAYPQQPYRPGIPQQPPYYPATLKNNGKAIASLVLGIVGLFFCPFICSLLAIVLGYSARKEIAASAGLEGGEGLATAGLVMGCIGLVIGVILAIIVAALSVSSAVAFPFFLG
ncbi:MAG: DUF4190 domain-containing protein [Actinomycetota bacterium]